MSNSDARARVLAVLARGGWVPDYELSRDDVGGFHYRKRISELQRDGYDIRIKIDGQGRLNFMLMK